MINVCTDHPIHLRAALIAAVFLTHTYSFCSTCHTEVCYYTVVDSNCYSYKGSP